MAQPSSASALMSAHLLDGVEHVLGQRAPKPIATLLDDAPKECAIVVAGMISAIDRWVNKQGEPWAIVTWRTWTPRWRSVTRL
jgi:DNA polymerase-3 subunit alpha